MKTTKSNKNKTLTFEMEVPGEFRINEGLTDSRMQKEMRILITIMGLYIGFVIDQFYNLSDWQLWFIFVIQAIIVVYITEQIKNYNKPL